VLRIWPVTPYRHLAQDLESRRQSELAQLLERVACVVRPRGASAQGDTDQKGVGVAVSPARLDLEDGQEAVSALRLTGRAGTTVEIACL
jgi:hypothetical protein